MKILFVNNFSSPDYQNDMVYHGLIENDVEVYETSFPWYMLTSCIEPHNLYGKGFSIFAKLSHTPNVESPETIIDKIQSKFYDLVIYGSIHRDRQYIEEVVKYYSRDKIFFIDGEDGPDYITDVLNYGLYFKRECINNLSIPITFAIPQSQLISNKVDKTKMFAHIKPGDLSTYIFNTESEYYNDYASSLYGITTKKAGWDCMRHYEILANKCIPYFIDLQHCPSLTLSTFPKDIILDSNQYAMNNLEHPNYKELNDELFNYTKSNLTTKHLATYLLNFYN
jgi:hypothetical protein